MSKIVIVGAGASGLVSSIYASKNNKVILLEKNNDVGKKLSITGNGRCNYFNDDMDINHFYSSSMSKVKKIINNNNIKKVEDFFNKIGIIPKIINGYYYPYSNQASSIVTSLKNEAEKNGVEIITNFNVVKIEKKDKFYIYSNNEKIVADKLVLATGSLSYPKTGSTGFGYEILKDFNLDVINPLPALCALESDNKYNKKLSGIRLDAKLDLYEDNNLIKTEKGELLLTDYGISGICTFNLSGLVNKGLYNNKKEEIVINFVNMLNCQTKVDFLNYLDDRDKKLKTRNISELFEGFINYKLVNVFLGKYKEKKWNKLKREEKDIIASLFYEHKIKIIGSKSFEKSQTNSGGLNLDELDLNTFEVKKIKNLYVIGDLLDIYADCGGYNLTLSWISGIKSGENL